MALPNFLCIGTEKAGTSPLTRMLMQHPEIFIPRKETAYFSRARVHEGAMFYETTEFKLYRGQPVLGELTPEYIRVPGLAAVVRNVLGRIKIVICLREPLRRAFSHYLQCLRLAEDNRSFCAACEYDARLPLDCDQHQDVRRAYVRGSWYPHQIREWEDEFGRGNMFFCVLERDFTDDRAKRYMIGRLFDFLGVSRREIDLNVYNSSLPAPEITFFDRPGLVKNPSGADVQVRPGDILLMAGTPNLTRVIVRPSPAATAFFETMAREMTTVLRLEDMHALRSRYFTGVAEETSEVIGEDLTDLWC
jgi:hypothetical protein